MCASNFLSNILQILSPKLSSMLHDFPEASGIGYFLRDLSAWNIHILKLKVDFSPKSCSYKYLNTIKFVFLIDSSFYWESVLAPDEQESQFLNSHP